MHDVAERFVGRGKVADVAARAPKRLDVDGPVDTQPDMSVRHGRHAEDFLTADAVRPPGGAEQGDHTLLARIMLAGGSDRGDPDQTTMIPEQRIDEVVV